MQKNSAVHINQLRFRFPKQPMLFEKLDLTILQGTTFGILGPNGAGKSTLIKIAIGLIPFKSGTVNLFGKNIKEKRKEILEQVGYLIEGPRLYPHLSGIDNLKVFAIYRRAPDKNLTNLIAEVGLSSHANKLVRYYSTGMKQRLAIAIAMMHDPALLILDEPTNGLDPQGIAEIRQLILELKNNPNRTIIFCSHILSEVQQVCDEVGILHDGQFVFQGSTQHFAQKTNQFAVETNKLQFAESILINNKNWKIKIHKKELLLELKKEEAINDVIDILRKNDVQIFQIKKIEKNLESTYLQFVKRK